MCWTCVASGLFSSWGEWGLLSSCAVRVSFSVWWFLLWSRGFRNADSVTAVAVALRLHSTVSVFVVHGLRCSAACGIFLGQRLSLSLLHWQADSLPLSQQRSPSRILKIHLLINHMPGVLQSTGSQRVGPDWVTELMNHIVPQILLLYSIPLHGYNILFFPILLYLNNWVVFSFLILEILLLYFYVCLLVDIYEFP